MLAVSTEKLKKTEPAYELACNLWRDIIPIILPTLLQLVRYGYLPFIETHHLIKLAAMPMLSTTLQTGADCPMR